MIGPGSDKKSLNRLLNKFRQKGTVQDLRKRRPCAREGLEEVTNEEMVLCLCGPYTRGSSVIRGEGYLPHLQLLYSQNLCANWDENPLIDKIR